MFISPVMKDHLISKSTLRSGLCGEVQHYNILCRLISRVVWTEKGSSIWGKYTPTTWGNLWGFILAEFFSLTKGILLSIYVYKVVGMMHGSMETQFFQSFILSRFVSRPPELRFWSRPRSTFSSWPRRTVPIKTTSRISNDKTFCWSSKVNSQVMGNRI